MPPKKKTAKAAPRQLPTLPAELVEQLANGATTAGEILDITTALKKALIERALKGELGHHLGYPPGSERPESTGNQRNGTSSKTVLTEDGPLRGSPPFSRTPTRRPTQAMRSVHVKA